MGSEGSVHGDGARSRVRGEARHQPRFREPVQLAGNGRGNQKVHGQKVLWGMACRLRQKLRTRRHSRGRQFSTGSQGTPSVYPLPVLQLIYPTLSLLHRHLSNHQEPHSFYSREQMYISAVVMEELVHEYQYLRFNLDYRLQCLSLASPTGYSIIIRRRPFPTHPFSI